MHYADEMSSVTVILGLHIYVTY